MADQNQNTDPNAGGTGDNQQQQQVPTGNSGDDLNAKIQAGIDTALQPIKAKLDNAYAARDEALAKVAEFERKEREREIARLKEEGKHQEAHEQEIAEERAKRTAAEKRVIELTRNSEVRDSMAGLEFRNKKAQDLAFQEVVSQLVQNEKGDWVHKSGATVKDFVESFAKDDSNNFLFKPKVNSGSGSGQPRNDPPPKQASSLYGLSQEEVLKLAAEGKLPRRNKR